MVDDVVDDSQIARAITNTRVNSAAGLAETRWLVALAQASGDTLLRSRCAPLSITYDIRWLTHDENTITAHLADQRNCAFAGRSRRIGFVVLTAVSLQRVARFWLRPRRLGDALIVLVTFLADDGSGVLAGGDGFASPPASNRDAAARVINWTRGRAVARSRSA